MSALTVLLGALIPLYIAYSIWSWHRLSHIPGPFWAAWTKFWIIRESYFGRQPTTLRDVTDRYGTLARVGPNELVTSDPELLRKIMSVRSAYSRGPWYDAWKLEAGTHNLFSMRDEVAHTSLRKKMTAGYSGKENESMEQTIEIQVAKLIELIKSKYVSSASSYRSVDLAEKLQYLTLDVISDLAFGKPLGYLQQDADPYDYLQSMDASMPVLAVLGNIPWLADLFHSPLLRRFLPSELDKGGFGALIGFSKRVVAERFDETAVSQPDMLGSFIRHGLDQKAAAGEALLQVVAGTDTTATGLKIIMMHIMTNPTVYKRLQEEIDSSVANGTVSSPVKDIEARQMPYLQAVIKEGLRMKSPAGGAFFKTVPSGGDVINGLFVPAGTEIGVSHLSFLHSKQIFGSDAMVFRPERWLEADPEYLTKMNSVVDLIFHAGKYQCLGKSVALMEFNKLFVELLRAFDFSIVNVEKPAHVTNAGVWLIKDFWVRISLRY
ncbi:cytochrome P450 [Boeremia exigua]|uniref:cytochrome P450 n=1 Tax=Boeremia exigua TaxID=749465 RepID=UPI001E8DD653|nr:cytochrome P450 [Boeremia exigua]KAH6629589.1 cytochrome P450 [Boeremia exigua]